MRNLEMDDLSHKVMFHELVRGSLALFVAIALPAAAVAQKLGSYIGVPAVQLIETLGEPLLRTPNELWYSTPTDIVGGRYAAPIISGSGGLGGLSVGSIYQPLSLAERPCSISVAIGATGLVETVEQSGDLAVTNFSICCAKASQTDPQSLEEPA